ncbi:hypothetical protein JRO89_XS12G0036500 [Xanthoceras sorbifolium]|uniref:DYW domain-containing protein n=1 Tax=Xanthoceras sorbifolium TaxID=99658 RepID=A0ABQ8HAY0_9ROSI|nr:hypothetical protein JRO89_XS12G0036500 [Xanthoceras sorbifolium]
MASIREKQERAEAAARQAASDLRNVNRGTELYGGGTYRVVETDQPKQEQQRPGVIGTVLRAVQGTYEHAKEAVVGKSYDAAETTKEGTESAVEKARQAKDTTTEKARETTDQAAKKTEEYMDSAAQKAKETKESAKGKVGEYADKTKESTKSAAEKAREAKDQNVEKAGEYKDYTAEKARETKDAALGKAGEYADKTKETTEWAAEKAREAKDAALGKAGEYKDYTAEKARETKDAALGEAGEYKEYTAEKSKDATDSAMGKAGEYKDYAAEKAKDTTDYTAEKAKEGKDTTVAKLKTAETKEAAKQGDSFEQLSESEEAARQKMEEMKLKGKAASGTIFGSIGNVTEAIKSKFTMPHEVVEETRAAREQSGGKAGPGEKIEVDIEETRPGAVADTLKANHLVSSYPLTYSSSSSLNGNIDVDVEDLFTLLRLSVQSGDLSLAKSVHASILKLEEHRDTRSVIPLISASYLKLGHVFGAYKVFAGLSCPKGEGGIEPNEHSFVAILTACIRMLELELGLQVHALIVKMGFCKNGQGTKVLDLFVKMVEEGSVLTDFTLTSVLMLVACLWMPKLSEQIHGFVMKFGFGSNAHIEASLLLDMWTRCGRMTNAKKMFNRGRQRHRTGQLHNLDLNDMRVCGYARNGQPEDAIYLFQSSQSEGMMVADEVALVRMYFKCYNMNDAIKSFNVMPSHDIVSWNGLIAGHLLLRQGDEALTVWSRMENASIKPDAHYASFVGVLGYWGFLDEAEEVINNMPFKPKASVWRALLDSCRIHLIQPLANVLLSIYFPLSHRTPLRMCLYPICIQHLEDGMTLKWSGRICDRRDFGNTRSKWIIHQNKLHSFYARDKSHPQEKDIYSGLEVLILECVKAGYVPDTSFVLHEVEEHQKKNFLFYHSAKLAATYGLLITRPGQPIRMVKNILVCGDCHTFLKHVSVVTKRDIFLRDASGFHCFVNASVHVKITGVVDQLLIKPNLPFSFFFFFYIFCKLRSFKLCSSNVFQ